MTEDEKNRAWDEFWDRMSSPDPVTHEVIFSRYDSGVVQTTFVDGEKKEIWPNELDWGFVQFDEDCDERDEDCMRKFVLRVGVECGFGKYDNARLIVCENGCVCIRTYHELLHRQGEVEW